MKLFKIIIKFILGIFGFYSISTIKIKFNIPINTIKNEKELNNLKEFNLFKCKLYYKNEIKELILRLKKNYIHKIKIDEFLFKMTFLDYPLDKAIIERIEGLREPNTISLIKALVMPNSKVLELGGCYGYFTNIISNCVGDKGQVISIEGTPNNFAILKKNVELNNLKNVKIYNVFIADNINRKKVIFSSSSTNPYEVINKINQDINFEFENNKDQGTVVEVINISEFLYNNNFFPDYIFMDIEGFEVNVMEDLSNIFFKKYKPIIIFEIHNQFYKKNKNLLFIKSILKNNGYYIRKNDNNMICFPENTAR